jgi:hypothetical protein
MGANCENTIERIYLKVTNRNAKLYWVDIVPNSDTLTVGIKTEDAGYIYPFTSNGATLVGNKNYYFCRYCNGFVIEDDVQIITREEYIKEYLNREISKVRIPYEATQMTFDTFLCELYKSVMNSVNIHKSHYYAVPEWIESTRQSFITCKPSDIYFSNCTFKDDTDTDVEFWVVCSQPGIFIGRGGENIDYWRDLLQAYIDKWCELSGREPLKLGIRIEERDLFKYDSSLISL